jgi:phosphatidylserine/phosphatidylglycerophosphate/cardiolipin synthase-like enzyme
VNVRALEAELLQGRELYERVVLEAMMRARESVVISTANVKAMLVELDGSFAPVAVLFAKLAARGVSVRVLHAELPSRPFRAAFDRQTALVKGGMTLKQCPRVHFKAVLIDGAWLYLGSANLTGAGLGAKGDGARNFEVGMVTEDFDTIDRVTALFESVWSGAECRTCRLYDLCPDPIGPRPKRARAKKKASGSNVVLGRSRRFTR